MQTAWQRYEVKFIVDEGTAERITRYCRANLRFDAYCVGRPGYRYPIHSVYLDSPDFVLARSVVERRADRYKLRVRTYREFNQPMDGLPTFFEVKRKLNGVVYKTRVRLSGPAVPEAFWNNFLGAESESQIDDRSRKNITKFMFLRQRLQAQPVISVHYEREAYESDFGQRVRVSLDRSLRYGVLDTTGQSIREVWWPLRLQGVILEIKFTDTYPDWVENLLEKSDLVRRGICKYLMCSQAANGLFQPLEEARYV
ncbi:MAG: hypothetical protein DCC65_00635 [Planctomycetota bacterium]|nr:MAG: hypothetical protein DCC65_00635 [Planctomycetota bacterium]